MLVGSEGVSDSLLFNKSAHRFGPLATDKLRDCILDAEREIDTPGVFGGRVWLVPSWHLAMLGNRVTEGFYFHAVELQKAFVDRPRMYQLACVMGPLRGRANVKWTVGKGFVGRLSSQQPEREYEILQHNTFWPDNLMTMSKKDWERVDESISEGRKLEEAQRLKLIYGTAIGASIITNSYGRGGVAGCLTIHSAADKPIEDGAAERCAEWVVFYATRIGLLLDGSG